MIISEKHRFVFVHIPKCAGTSIRNPLTPFNEWQLAGPPWQKKNSVLGTLDYGHIPLFTLRHHFPAEFEAVRDYWSFAVMRDPFDRFASSVSQRLRMYSDQPIQKRSLDEVRLVIDESIDYLSRQPREGHLLPPEYIHFQKQVDYIQLDGVRVLDTIYTVNEINDLLLDVGRRVGQNLGEPGTEGGVTQANRTVVFRNDLLRRVIETARPLTDRLGKVLPESVKQQVRERVYVPRDQRMKDLFEADDVQAFVLDYYADDIALCRHVNQHERSDAS
ncbi:sulfotransferase family 2 domain-containing protein [Marinobacter sp. HL-58]|uniref:sulfotransferase family 2 domain-containing protein n=1 Tax=Marinobacter sp. HL-58 TaxID=1479237 RepID=UPI0006D96462|nr:sulfotransferase family 2 domain-containing protein [Marinobacter sp. HL-58]KPP97788.1 MAG: Sulfotransferase family [Marinobacter sp. HL-58]